MKIAYVTVHDVSKWSAMSSNVAGVTGNASYMAKALQDQGLELDFIGPLPNHRSLLSRLRELYYGRLRGKRILSYAEATALRATARYVESKLADRQYDVVFSNMARAVAYLDVPRPIVTWRDATFAGALEIHRDFRNTAPFAIKMGHAMEKAALDRCALSIFRSDWAAKSAIEYYGADPARVAVVPTGGNRGAAPPLDEVRSWVVSRSKEVCRLLFMGVQWKGKGGPLALEVVRRLNESGLRAQLTIVGCKPELEGAVPEYLKLEGFVNPGTAAGAAKLSQFWKESHFLLLPSTVDTYGNVFPEANANAVPCLTTNLAGIPSIIRNDVNGRMFDPQAPAADYCSYIARYWSDPRLYQEMALASHHEYETRLSWDVAGRRVKELLGELVRGAAPVAVERRMVGTAGSMPRTK